MKKHYFFSCVINGERINGETLSLAGTMQKLTCWALSGFRISNVTFKAL